MTGNNRNTQAGRKGHAKRQQKKKTMNKPTKVNTGQLNKLSSMMALMSTTANYRPMNNKTVSLTGSDFLGRVSVDGTGSPTVANSIRKTLPISPSAYPGTRLTQLAELWERYRFKKFNVRYVPSVPNTVACQVLLYQDTDPADDPTTITDVDALIRQGVTQAGSQQWNFNQPKIISLAKRADNELYYTGVTKQNERFNYQGTAYLLQVTRPMDFNGTTIEGPIDCGSLYIDWECEFQTAQINPTAVSNVLNDKFITEKNITFDVVGKQSVTVPDGHRAILSLTRLYTDPGASSSTFEFNIKVDGESNGFILGDATSFEFNTPTIYLSSGTHQLEITSDNVGLNPDTPAVFHYILLSA